MPDIGEWVKEHPALVVGGVVIVGLGVFLLLSGGGSGSAATSGADPNALAYAAQQNQITAAANSQASSQSFQLAAYGLQGQTQLALLQEKDATDIVQAGTAAQVATNANQWNFQLGIAQIGANLEGLKDTNASSVAMANIAANENTAIATTNAGVAINSANQWANVEINSSNNWRMVEQTIAKENTKSSIARGVLGIAAAFFG